MSLCPSVSWREPQGYFSCSASWNQWLLVVIDPRSPPLCSAVAWDWPLPGLQAVPRGMHWAGGPWECVPQGCVPLRYASSYATREGMVGWCAGRSDAAGHPGVPLDMLGYQREKLSLMLGEKLQMRKK